MLRISPERCRVSSGPRFRRVVGTVALGLLTLCPLLIGGCRNGAAKHPTEHQSATPRHVPPTTNQGTRNEHTESQQQVGDTTQPTAESANGADNATSTSNTTADHPAVDASAASQPSVRPLSRHAEHLLGILRDESAAIDLRLQAAGRLIRGDVEGQDGQVASGPPNVPLAALTEILSEPGGWSSQSAKSILLRAIYETPAALPVFDRPIVPIARAEGAAADAPAEIRVSAVRALGSIRTRLSARTLIDVAANPEPIGPAAIQSLVRLSGRADLGAERSRWEVWFGQVEWSTEAEWRRVLIEGLAARADGLASKSDVAVNKLVDVLARRYAAAESSSDRSAQLVSMLRDELVAVKRLGFTLAMSELANARTLDRSVADAAIVCLQDGDTDVRVSAADLLRLIATDDHAEPLVTALLVETDPPAASRLLACAARFPRPEILQPSLRWLAHGPITEGAAIDALLALHRAGLIPTGEAVDRVAEMLGRIDADSPGLSPRQRENRQTLLEAFGS